MPFRDFYTYVQDLQQFGHGTPLGYRYVASVFATDPLGDVAQGEMVAWDSTNRRVVRLIRSGPFPFIGVARENAAGLLRLGNQPGLRQPELSVWTSGIHQLNGTSGEQYFHGDPVFMSAALFGTDTTTITKVKVAGSGNTQVGTVNNPQNFTLLGGSGRVPVLIDLFTQTQQ